MDVFSYLQTTAEVAVTFAGFISIFMVLAGRGESLNAEIASLIRFILLGSIATLFIAVVPLVLSLMMPEGPLWRLASGGGLIAGLLLARVRDEAASAARGQRGDQFCASCLGGAFSGVPGVYAQCARLAVSSERWVPTCSVSGAASLSLPLTWWISCSDLR